MPSNGWATKEERDFLTSLIPEYEAHQVKRRYKPFWQRVNAEYLAKFPMIEKLFPGMKVTELSPEQKEMLTSAVVKQQQRIKECGRTRPRRAHEIFAKLYSEEVDEAKARLCEEEGLSGRKTLHAWHQASRELYDSASSEQVKAVRKVMAEEALKPNEGPADTPSSYLRYLKKLPTLLDATITPAVRQAGVLAFVTIVGPDPEQNGKITCRSVQFGDKPETPVFSQVWEGHDSVYSEELARFARRHEFPPDVCLARSLNHVETASTSSSTSSKDSEPDQIVPVAPLPAVSAEATVTVLSGSNSTPTISTSSIESQMTRLENAGITANLDPSPSPSSSPSSNSAPVPGALVPPSTSGEQRSKQVPASRGPELGLSPVSTPISQVRTHIDHHEHEQSRTPSPSSANGANPKNRISWQFDSPEGQSLTAKSGARGVVQQNQENQDRDPFDKWDFTSEQWDAFDVTLARLQDAHTSSPPASLHSHAELRPPAVHAQNPTMVSSASNDRSSRTRLSSLLPPMSPRTRSPSPALRATSQSQLYRFTSPDEGALRGLSFSEVVSFYPSRASHTPNDILDDRHHLGQQPSRIRTDVLRDPAPFDSINPVQSQPISQSVPPATFLQKGPTLSYNARRRVVPSPFQSVSATPPTRAPATAFTPTPNPPSRLGQQPSPSRIGTLGGPSLFNSNDPSQPRPVSQSLPPATSLQQTPAPPYDDHRRVGPSVSPQQPVSSTRRPATTVTPTRNFVHPTPMPPPPVERTPRDPKPREPTPRPTTPRPPTPRPPTPRPPMPKAPSTKAPTPRPLDTVQMQPVTLPPPAVPSTSERVQGETVFVAGPIPRSLSGVANPPAGVDDAVERDSVGQRRRSARGSVPSRRLEQSQQIGSNCTQLATAASHGDESEGPLWFNSALECLRAYDLGDEWLKLVNSWANLESLLAYGKVSKGSIRPEGRPEEWVKWTAKSWQGTRRYDIVPAVHDPADLGIAIARWWLSLQPSFRASDGAFPLPVYSSPDVSDTTDHWATLRKSGQNGFVCVILLLAWWGWAAATETSEWLEDSRLAWEHLVQDAIRTLEAMISSFSTLPRPEPKKRTLEKENVVPPRPKRQRTI